MNRQEAFEEIRESDQRVRIQQYDSQEARSKAINDTDSCNLQKSKIYMSSILILTNILQGAIPYIYPFSYM